MERLTKSELINGFLACYPKSDSGLPELVMKSNPYRKIVEKLKKYEDLEEQGLLLKLPCEVGDTVYVVGTCEDVENVLDGTMYDSAGGPGTATGYYCPYELSESCPHEDCVNCPECKNKFAVFEDTVLGFGVYEGYTMIYTVNLHYCAEIELDFGRTVFLARAEAEEALRKIKNGTTAAK